MRWLRVGVLALWAGFLAWLYASGEIARYLGPRTYWVVPIGIVMLAGAACGVAFVRSEAAARPPTVGDVVAMLVLVTPLAAVLTAPASQLGSLAAARKSSRPVAGATAIALPNGGEEISFAEIDLAGRSPEYAAAAGVAEGLRVRLTGFVTPVAGAPRGEFDLTRFYVYCCAADAVPYAVRVKTDRSYSPDSWLTVSGVLARRGDRWVLVAGAIRLRPAPDAPYLY